MKAEYDFSRGKRGAVLSSQGKTRITIYLDDEIVKAFKAESERTGKGYQTLINESLAQHIGIAETPVTAAQLREILREELAFPKKTSLDSPPAAEAGVPKQTCRPVPAR
jgi:BrnA antitoxin of type II toxin-antitoxin system